MDSLLDDRNCRMDSVIRTIQPALDSIKTASRAQMDRLLTPEQKARIEARRKDDAARHSAERKRQQSLCTK
jgi:Spy/CpxP family protein refolding chaperone